MGTKTKVTSSFTKTLAQYKSAGIDSMCFIYYFEGNKTYGELVKTIFTRLHEGKLSAVTSALTLAELLAHEKLQKNIMLFEETKSRLRTTPNLTILSADEQICEAAAILKQTYKLTLPDAIQLASAVVSGQAAFISNDQKLQKVKEIKVLLLDDFL